MNDIKSLHARIGNSPTERQFKGRVAWTLSRLVEAGDKGVTPLEYPAPRWSDYVFKLRRNGVAVETIHEKHGGTYSGTHARYRLAIHVTIVSENRT